MERAFRHLLGAAAVHRTTGLAIVTGLAVLAVVRLPAVSFDSNVLNLLPQGGPALGAFRDYLSTFGNLDRLYVAIEAPEGAVIADYADDVNRYIDRLRALPEITHVDAGLDAPSRDWSYVLDRQLLLLDDETLSAALERLEPGGTATALTRARERLAVPTADMRALVQDDPLGWLLLLRSRLSSDGVPFSWSDQRGGYFSEDGRAQLLIAQGTHPPQDTAFARQLNDAVDAASVALDSPGQDTFGEPLPPVTLDFGGGYRVAPEIESLIRTDGIKNGVTSFVGIALLVLFVFRSPRPLVLISLPILVAALITIVLQGLWRPLSTAAAGSAAMLFGLGVDGTLLLYVRYLAGRRLGLDCRTAIVGLAAAAVSVGIGFTTTAATFLGLVPLDFPALAELGRIIGLGILLCGVLTIVLVPALVPRHPTGSQLRRLETPWLANLVARHRRSILVAAAAATVVLGAAAPGVQVVPTVDRLQARTAGSATDEHIAARFGLPADTVLFMASGSDLDALLTVHEALDAALRRPPAVPASSPTGLLPPAATQATIAGRLAESTPLVERFRARLETATAAAGFRAGTFASFASRLPQLLNPAQRLTLEGYRQHGLADLVGRHVQRDGNLYRAVTYAYPRDAAERERLNDIAATMAGQVVMTGLSAVNAELASRFWPTLLLGGTLGMIGVVTLMAVAFRSLPMALLALLPTVLGLVWSAGLLSLGGAELDLFSVFALLMSIGIGVDYGVHILHHRRSHGSGGLRAALDSTAPAILLAAGSTILGFGSLMFSTYAPLGALGLVTALTVSTVLVAALLVLPSVLGDQM